MGKELPMRGDCEYWEQKINELKIRVEVMKDRIALQEEDNEKLDKQLDRGKEQEEKLE